MFYYLFWGWGALAKAKEGQKRRSLSKKRVPKIQVPGVIIPSQHSHMYLYVFVPVQNYDMVALIPNGHLCHSIKVILFFGLNAVDAAVGPNFYNFKVHFQNKLDLF